MDSADALIPLSALFHRALTSASQSHNLPTTDENTQKLIQSSSIDLREVESRVTALSLFSVNESLDDISTRDLVYLLVPWLLAEVSARVLTREREDRVMNLRSVQRYFHIFLAQLENFSIISKSERELYEHKISSITDPAKKRALKIKQYQQEKEIRARIETISERRHFTPSQAMPSTDFDMIASLLPPQAPPRGFEVEEDDQEMESILRETTILLFRLAYSQTHAQLLSIEQELQLLNSMPPPTDMEQRSEQSRGSKGKETSWKLDAPESSAHGPLLDTQGRPLRPFTIMPAGTADRARLQKQVFGPDHTLPSMTVDEYLEIEKARGGIVSGGGPRTAPTSSEQLVIDSEQDGTIFGEEKAEERRLKEEKWAQFTDENPKGAGNTMNRG